MSADSSSTNALPDHVPATNPAAMLEWLMDAPPTSSRTLPEHMRRALVVATHAESFAEDLLYAVARVREARFVLYKNAALLARPAEIDAWLTHVIGAPDEDFPPTYVQMAGDAMDAGLLPEGSAARDALRARRRSVPQGTVDVDAIFAMSVLVSDMSLPESELVEIVTWLPGEDAVGAVMQIADHPNASGTTYRAIVAKFSSAPLLAWRVAALAARKPAMLDDPVVFAALCALFEDPSFKNPPEEVSGSPAIGVLVDRVLDAAPDDASWRRRWLGVAQVVPFISAMQLRRQEDPRLEGFSSDDIRALIENTASRDLRTAAAWYLPAVMRREIEALTVPAETEDNAAAMDTAPVTARDGHAADPSAHETPAPPRPSLRR